jgi:peptide/nickel transport system ATP-binding protein
MTDAPLIEIEGLRVIFHGDDGRTTHAVDRVDLSVANGATLGLVGESGCGKSVTSLAIMGLLSKHSAEVTGSIRFDGFDLLEVPDDLAQPESHRWRADHRDHPAPSRRIAAHGA